MVKVFITGGSGWIGSHIIPELLGRGHQVTALARSDASESKLQAAGAKTVRGDLTTHDVLTAAARDADAVIHAAFIHDFDAPDFDYSRNVATSRAAVSAMADGLKPGSVFVNTGGTLLHTPGEVLTEDVTDDVLFNRGVQLLRHGDYSLLKDKGLRPIVIRLSPTVHGTGDSGFIPIIIGIDRKAGVASYVGDGSARWSGVHVKDAARLFVAALEKGQEGFYHGASSNFTIKELSELIASKLGIKAQSITPEEAEKQFGPFFCKIIALDSPVDWTITKKITGWEPTFPTLLDDLKTSSTYFDPTRKAWA